MAARVPPERLAFALKGLAAFKASVDVERELAAAFQIDVRTARRAVAAARAQLAAETLVDREAERAKVRAILHRVIGEALDRQHHRVALQALATLVQLDGLSDEVQRFAVEHGFVPDSPVLGARALAERFAELEARAKAVGKAN